MRRWTDKEDNLIKEYYFYKPIVFIESKIGRKWSAIRCRAEKLKIKRPREANYTNIKFFDKWSNDMAYVLGFVAADGGIYDVGDRRKTLYITLSVKDKWHLENIKNLLCYDKKLYIYDEILGDKIIHKCSLRIGSKYLCSRLIDLGIIPRKSLSLQFPRVPERYLNHFVRGYFDGDGCLSKNNANDWFLTIVGSFDFLNDLQRNINDTLGIGNKNLILQKNIYRLTYSTQQAIKVCSWMYKDSTVCLGRKHNKYLQLIDEKRAAK